MNNESVIKVGYDEPELAPPAASSFAEQLYGYLPRLRWKNVGRIITIKITDDATAFTTGDGKFIFEIPQELDASKLLGVRAFVSTVSAASGPISIQIRNITDSVDVLSTALTIDDTEYSSDTAATPAVINQANNLFQNRDRIAIDIDDAGDGAAKGLLIYLSFQ